MNDKMKAILSGDPQKVELSEKDRTITRCLTTIQKGVYKPENHIVAMCFIFGVMMCLMGLFVFSKEAGLSESKIMERQILSCFLPILLSGIGLFGFLMGKSDVRQSKVDICKNISTLFHLMSETPYEIRAEFVEKSNSKVKVIVEGNIIKEGGHVIKSSSKHFTSYVDIAASQKSFLNFMVDLVKETEKFSGKNS